ncbi:MAG: hypothetical protein ABWZ63_05485 [Thermoleophilaceae bacterium]
MSVSRPFLIALIGVVLLGATVFAVQNSRNAASSDPVQSQPASEAAPQLTPKQQLEAAFTNDDLKSARFEGELSFSSLGQENVLETSGVFEDRGPKEMPVVDIKVNVDAESANLDLEGGFGTNGDKAWFTRGDSAYAVPQDAWDKIVEARETGAGAGQDSPTLNLEPNGWLRKVASEDGGEIDGVETTHLSADVDAAAAIAQIAQAMADAGQLGASPLPDAAQRLGGLLSGAELEVWVGKDEIIRRLTFELSGKGDANRPVDMDLRLELSGVNEPQDVSAPAKLESNLPGGQYGQFAQGVVAGVGSSFGADASALSVGAPNTNAHLKAERAVADHRKVVIFFGNPQGADDRAVSSAVRALDRETRDVVVLTDHVGNVDKYGSMVEDLGVSQTPAVVVIDRQGSARLLEGYIDAASLVQVVADAR